MNFIRKNHFGISGEIINEKWFDVKMAGWPFLDAFNLLEMKSSVIIDITGHDFRNKIFGIFL